MDPSTINQACGQFSKIRGKREDFRSICKWVWVRKREDNNGKTKKQEKKKRIGERKDRTVEACCYWPWHRWRYAKEDEKEELTFVRKRATE